MPVFEGPGFKISLPEGCADLSTYAFAMPSATGFQPSVVIKFQKGEGPPDLNGYVNQQLAALQQGLADFQLLAQSGGRHGDFQAVTLSFEWGSQGQPRLRQKQRYVSVPQRSTIYTLTATSLAADFDQTEKLFDAVIGSFVPKCN